jgi:mandelate racemase
VTLPTLTIRALRTVAVEVPMTTVLGTSAGIMKTAHLLLIDVETEEGITGRNYVFGFSRNGARLIAEAVAGAGEIIAGMRVAPAEIAALLQRRFLLIGVTGVVRMALSGIDSALWDAVAVAAGVPLAVLLGGVPKRIPAYNSNGLGIMDAEAVADEALQLLAAGFSAVKLRLGYPSLEQDVLTARTVQKRIPAGTTLMADYNQTLSTAEAVRRGHALDAEGLYWIEEPIRHDDYAGNAKIARELKTPVQIGENFNGPAAMAEALAAGACDLVMPDLARIGGVTGWMQAAGIAAGSGIPMSSHLFPETSVHLLAVTPTAHWLEYMDWASALVEEPLRIADGHATVPDRPGCGIVWDPKAVAKYRLG